jgi:hypothetical protein
MNNLTRLKNRTGEDNEELLRDLLMTAKVAIMKRRFPFKSFTSDCFEDYDVEATYSDLQYRIAMDLYNKIGAEGEIIHSANGISRTYESSWISAQLLLEVVPKYEGIT